MTQIHGIVWPGTLLLPRLSYAYRSIQAVVSGRRQWRPFPSTLRFHLLFLPSSFFHPSLLSIPRFLSHPSHPTWSYVILESHPLLHFDSSHCPLARYTPRLERILPRYHSRFTPLHLPNARVPVDERYESTSPLPPLQPTFPSCPAQTIYTFSSGETVTTRLRRRTVTTGWRAWRRVDERKRAVIR